MFEGLFQPMHLLIIFFIALLVFGPKKLPELGKGIGDGIRALKEGMKTDETKAAEVKAAEVRAPEVRANDVRATDVKPIEVKPVASPDLRPVITPENNPENKA